MDTLSRPTSTYTAHSLNSPYHTSIGNSPNHDDQRPVTKPFKLSKRVNARLQLAAALIEADNEEIERKNAAQWHGDTMQASLQVRQPKLASESVIFAPYRDENQHHPGEVTGGRRLSSGGLDSEGRPVIDFLGVKLPAEKRQARTGIPDEGIVGGRRRTISPAPASRQSRPVSYATRVSTEWPSRPVSGAGSHLSASRPVSTASRPLSHGSVAGEVDEDALSEWGVEKFLSSEARHRIETGRRSRANSVIERPESVMSSSSIGRAHSEVGTEASTLPPGDLTLSKLDLLARIKMYREGQKDTDHDLQKEAEEALYPSLGDDRLHGHLKALTTAEGSSVGVVSQARNTVVGGRKSMDLGRTLSKSGIMGDSWSEQGDETMDPSTVLSSQALDFSEIGEERARQEDADDGKAGREERSAPIEINRPPRIGSPIEDLEQHEDGMAGIGSFSRSPNSRPHSMIGTLLSPPPNLSEGRQLDEIHPSSKEDFPRPRSAHFASRPSEYNTTMEPAQTVRPSRSSPHLAMPSRNLSVSPNDASPRRVSMLNPAFSPRLRPTPDSILATIDPYFDMAGFSLSPYPTLAANAPQILEPSEDTSERLSVLHTVSQGSDHKQEPVPTYSLSTRQLQELAKQNSFPVSFGLSPNLIAAGLPDEDVELFKVEQEMLQEESGAQQPDSYDPLPISLDFPAQEEITAKEGDELSKAAPRPIEAFIGATQEPDLSSARWGRKKRKSLLANKIKLRKATLDNAIKGHVKEELSNDIADEDIDDEYTSPPTRGPLRPQGIESRLPSQLRMPPILAGTSLAPQRRLVDEEARITGGISGANKPRVPVGFVLHNRTETVSMKALKVQGASGAKPFFMSPKGRQKHDHLVSSFLQSQGAQRLIPVSASAPPGIGRRAAMNTTALFRNQLVQHEEEKEGWGWEAGSRIGTELVEVVTDEEGELQARREADASKKKPSRKDKRMAKKMRVEKQKRKEARRTRRKKRELARAKNVSTEELGVEKLSPDEDLDLSSTSSDEDSSDESDSEMSSLSHNEARWLDDNRPAGRLYGKSLLDVVDERKKKVSSKTRFYGQVRPEDLQDDGASIVASSVGGAPSFRDNPVGFNDTRERMEAMFGPDQVWAREMAKRKLEEAQEAEEATIRQMALAELEAEEIARKEAKEAKKTKKKGKKGKIVEVKTETVVVKPPGIALEPEVEVEQEIIMPTSAKPPTINLDLPQDSLSSRKPSSLSGAAAQWLDSDGSGDDSSDDSDAEAERRKQSLQRARMSRSLGGLGEKIVDVLAQDDSDDEEDDVPLSTFRSKLPPATFASRLGLQDVQQDSEEEEVPLSQLVANRKKRTQSLGTLDLNFMSGEGAPSQRGQDSARPKQLGDSEEDDEDDAPIGLKLAASAHAQQEAISGPQRTKGSEEEEDDSDNEPLGIAHPQAAVITEQANMIKRLQSELIFKQQQQQMMSLPGPYGFPNQHMFPSAPFPMRPMSMMPIAMPQMMPPVMMQSQDSSIAMWAAQVDPDAEKTV